MESLPDDVIFDILVRLPAQDIYEAARFVCSKWFHLARTHDFARAHLHHSTHGLLIQANRRLKYDCPILVGARNGRIEISNFEHYKFKGRIMSSCNGLILEHDRSTRNLLSNRLYITNPVTKQHFALPTNTTQIHILAIAYAAATKEYKVVCVIYDDISNSTPDGIAILTVRVDKDWTRRVDIRHLSLTDKGIPRKPPVATQGFVHWAEREYVLSLNVENEAITRSCAPCEKGEERLLYYYLSTGSCLSVLISSMAGFSWEVWVMESETGEWTKVTRVDLEGKKLVLEGMGCVLKGLSIIKPVGWSKFGEVLVFSSFFDGEHIYNGTSFAYNVGTREVESFELDPGLINFIVHRKSLVWLN